MGKGKIALIGTGITALVLTGVYVSSEIAPPKDNCINVYIDYGVLSDVTPDTTCVVATGKTSAEAVLAQTDLKFEYIDFGGDLGKAICTVNELPKLKSCAEMDWVSYWGTFEKHGANTLNVKSHWNMSQKGISFTELSPGDSIGLVYLKDGKIKYPNDDNN
jgi:hypothetical protein